MEKGQFIKAALVSILLPLVLVAISKFVFHRITIVDYVLLACSAVSLIMLLVILFRRH